MPMRALLAIAAFAALVATSSGHASERRIFIIANTAANPWGAGATTLEWTLPSPPPFHQFNELPRIK